jgi:uncharacterized membrane protein YbhN (UPF0104 family)
MRRASGGSIGAGLREPSVTSADSASDSKSPLQGLARPLAIGAVIAVGAYAVLAMLSDGEAVLGAMRSIPASLIGLALAASTGNFVLRALRWDFYLRALGVSVPWLDRWLVFLAGFSMSLTPGKVGELLKPGLLADRYGVSVSAVSSVVVAERITDLLGVAFLLGVGALADPSVALVAGVVWLGVGAALAVLLFPPLGALVVRLVRRLPLGDKVGGIVEGLFGTLRELSRPGVMLPAVALSVAAWFLQCLSLWWVAAGVQGCELSLLESILAYVGPLLAGAAALVPGGVGVAEATMAGLISRLGDTTMADGTAITAIARGLTLWWAVLVGVVALGVFFLRRPTRP